MEFFLNIFEHFIDPKKRIFLGYILASLLIAFVWLIYSKRLSPIAALRKIFDKRIFFSKSSRSDYLVFFLNRSFTLFISPMLITQLVIATVIFHSLHKKSKNNTPSKNSLSILLFIFQEFRAFRESFNFSNNFFQF